MSRSSKPSRRSKTYAPVAAAPTLPLWHPAALALALAALAAGAVWFFTSQGFTLYYGDALAHLNIARRMVDSRTPGWDQVGTVWLPLPHVLMLPLVATDWLWRSGLAGSIPSACCYVLGGVLFFLAVRRAFRSAAAGAAGCLLVALNPNVLYLSSIPMTEAAFFAASAGLLYLTVLFADTRSLGAAFGAGVFALAGTLTRYEGWFLLPFAFSFILFSGGRRRGPAAAAIFALVAGLGPLYWLAHNWWYFGRALEFYDGQYSAQAIYARALAAGMAKYPGDHDLPTAVRYFREGVRLFAGTPLLWMGAIGLAAALFKRALWPVLLLALVPLFYVASIHSAATPIFVPNLWPSSYYNTRYAMGALPLLALGAAGIVALAPARFRAIPAVLVVAVGLAPWAAYPRRENWICWKESQVNSDARRAWTAEAATYLKTAYDPRDGIFTAFGDLAGIYLEAGIPLRETLYDGNQPQWDATVARPDLFLWEEWAVAIAGDKVDTAIARAQKTGPRYDVVKSISVKGAPVIRIYRRIR